MHALGIIPARGGSKGVARKNLKAVAGTPLLVHAIQAGRESTYLDHVVVTTDDDEIAALAEDHGCAVVRRPDHLATDTAPMLPTVLHAIDGAEARWGAFEAAALLQPTTPQRTGRDIDACLKLLEATQATSVLTVYEIQDTHPARMYKLDGDHLVPLHPKLEFARRQDLPKLYHRNGAVYAFIVDLARKNETLVGSDARAHIMPKRRSLNIDDPLDLEIVDVLMSKRGGGPVTLDQGR